MYNDFFDDSLMREAVKLAKEHKTYLHEIPERALKEHKTTAYIKEICSRYPARYIDLGMETGATYYLDAGADETIALRADIDALPTEYGDLHLCGHDGHAAGLLGAMHYLAGAADMLPHNVLFIFQPAEEETLGAKSMLEHGLMEKLPQKPIRLFGIHNRPQVSCGDVVVHRGPLMAEKSVFKINFKGRTAHGGTPQKSIDPIVAAATFVTSVQTVISRNTDPFAPSLCTVNSFTAGRPDNPSPENALVTGFFRSYDDETHNHMEDRICELAEGIASAYLCKCDIKIDMLVPALINSDEMYEYAYKAAELAVGESHIVDSKPELSSEDFPVLGSRMPYFFYWVGSGEPGRDNAGWHEMDFSLGEKYLDTAVPVLVSSVMV